MYYGDDQNNLLNFSLSHACDRSKIPSSRNETEKTLCEF